MITSLTAAYKYIQVLDEHAAANFMVQAAEAIWLLVTEHKGTMLLQNVGNYTFNSQQSITFWTTSISTNITL